MNGDVRSTPTESPSGGRPGPGEPLLELRGISKYYDHVRALEGVDFDLYSGEVLALVGDNGAGKSTLIKVITGAVEPTRGRILVEGKEVHFRSPRDAAEHGITAVYQDLALVDTRDVLANLFLGREPTRWGRIDRRKMRENGSRVLAELGIRIPSLDAPVGHMSGGQRQTVAIGRALLQGSRIVILDEPTAALGVEETRKVLELIGRLRDRGLSVIVISHNLHHVFSIADRITILRSGQRVGSRRRAESTPEEIVGLITGAELIGAV